MKRGLAILTFAAIVGASTPLVYAATAASTSTHIATANTTRSANSATPATTWTVKPGNTLWKISQMTGVPIALIVEANDNLNPNSLRVGEVLQIPSVWTVHVGDTLWKIADATGDSTYSIEQANPKVNANDMTVGMKLIIPSTPSAPAPPSPSATTYTVKPGDTLWKISQRTGASISAIEQANPHLQMNDLRIGTPLVVPSSTRTGAAPAPTSKPPQPTPSVSGTTYTVKSGDTLWKIASTTGVTTEALVQANHLTDPNDLRVGQTLTVPSTASTGSTGSTTVPVITTLTTKWAGYEGDIGANIVSAGNNIVTADSDSNGAIYAYNVNTGQKAWEYDQQNYYNGMLAGSPSTVLVSQGNSGVLALSASTGTPIWNKSIGKPLNMDIANGIAFITTSNHQLCAFDATQGTTMWAQTLDNASSALGASTNQVLVGTSTGTVIGYTMSGSQSFQTSLSNSPITSIDATSGGWLIVQGTTLSYLDASGHIVWTTATSGAIVGGNVAVSGNTIYAIIGGQTMTTYDLQNGKALTTKELAFGVNAAPTAHDGVVYMSTGIGCLYVVDGTTLQTVSVTSQYHNQPLSTVSSPLVAGSSVVVQSHKQGYSGDAEVIAFSAY